MERFLPRSGCGAMDEEFHLRDRCLQPHRVRCTGETERQTNAVGGRGASLGMIRNCEAESFLGDRSHFSQIRREMRHPLTTTPRRTTQTSNAWTCSGSVFPTLQTPPEAAPQTLVPSSTACLPSSSTYQIRIFVRKAVGISCGRHYPQSPQLPRQ